LSEACFIIRAVKPFVSQDALNMIYYAYFNLVITYGLFYSGVTPHIAEKFLITKENN